MAGKTAFVRGDPVQVNHAGGRLMGRTVAGSRSRYGRMLDVYVVVPDRSYVAEVASSPELSQYDVPEVEVEWGQVPPKPWLAVPGHALEDPYSDGMRAYFVRMGLCPRCGDRGTWVRMACICDFHGPFLGA